MAGDRLTRDLDEAMLGGVLAGAARHWDLDVTLLRLLALIAIIPTGGLAIAFYAVAWMIVPRPDQLDDGGATAPAEPRPLRDRLRPGEVATAAREAGDAARRAADRINDAVRLASESARTAADAARTAADAARTAAEELSDIAHQPARRTDAEVSPVPPSPSSSTATGAVPERPVAEPPPAGNGPGTVVDPSSSSPAATDDRTP